MKCRNIELLLLTGILLVYSYATYQRNIIWKSGTSLWQDVIRKSPNKARPYKNLGVAYYRDNIYHQAITQFKKASAIKAQFSRYPL